MKQSIYLIYILVFSMACIPASARAIALLTEEFELYLPWIMYQGQTYSAFLNPENRKEQVFRLTDSSERENKASSGGLASVGDELEIFLPMVSYRGELYSASLRHNANSHFQIKHAAKLTMPEGRGAVLSVKLMEIKTVDQIAIEYPFTALAGLNPRYDVAVYRVGYQTQDAFGNLTAASGVIGTPIGIPTGAPLLSFQHGTIIKRDHAPSVNPEESGTDLALFLMGTRGYLTVAPDYLGFGDSNGLHLFMHAKTLAWAVIDLIRATRSLAADGGYPLNGQLFLAGYSEGGYATMAAQREIETYHADEFVITASAPMAGAYDLSGTMLQQILMDKPLPRPMYFPYVLLAYNQIYGFEDDITNLLATDDVAETIVELFDGAHDSDAIDAALPIIPDELFAPSLLTSLKNGDDRQLRVALENNDVYRWTPVSPTRLYHCLDDDRVPYENSTIAIDYFIAAGANVELETLFFGNHLDCAIPALLSGKDWFDSLAELP
ncbi:Secretory lipase [Nitrosomonas aestuarii]|uniref:Secretory lipase n=2 Tax=Nitrosomonas aestuarii TaxID=52441 RepID=A0A1I3XXH8_9PROT|nr:Secretory lipase [Nitrosomonas aestuarii]